MIDFILHFDAHLIGLVEAYGSFVYGILFFIIFIETGTVLAPFLPGDSLLFASGALAAQGSLSIWWLFGLLSLGAVLGDALNYWIGFWIGDKVLQKERLRFIKKEHLEKTQNYFNTYGAKTIIIARFIPIVRTFAPFLAGVGKMGYPKFFSYNVVGGISWVALFLFGGYLFGGLPFVEEHFTIVLLIIIGVSLLPLIWEFFKHRKSLQQKT